MEATIKNNFDLNSIPKAIPVVPAIDVIVFPNMIVPLFVLDERIMNGIEESMRTNKLVLLLSAEEQGQEIQEIDTDHLYSVGTIASIMRVINMPEGGVKILIQGICRAKATGLQTVDGILTANIEQLPFETESTEKIDAAIKNIKEISQQLAMTSQTFSPDFHTILARMQSPIKISEFILSHLELKTETAQKMLEQTDLGELLSLIYHELQREISIAEVQEKIRTETRDSINKNQNEFYLREQLKAIKKELGDDSFNEIKAMEQQIADKNIPEKTREFALKQLKRLERTSPESMEASVIRSHVEWLISLPWGEYTQDNLDIKHVAEILDEDHYGLQDIKDRILDFISVKNLKKDGHSPIICFTGPPGTGKTSLGKSIARALNKNFHRISLGGVKDESEIRGHRKTYVGAMPGRFIQGVKKAGSLNPVFLIDELDKLGSDFRGDPSAAMLEVLDPQQNYEFYDNYLGTPFDLSNIMFIATSNNIENISPPLRDRMEIIELSGYTLEEKTNIAEKYLMKQAFDETGITSAHLTFDNDIFAHIVSHYTRESGVRHLHQVINKLCAKAARHFLENDSSLHLTTINIDQYLGPKTFSREKVDQTNMVGIANGLAWTAVGGEVLKIESILMPGSGKLLLTGQLGDVMKESAQAALSYAKAHAHEFNIEPDLFTERDLHIHFPAGGVPKDGPSAGITILSSILSVLTNRPINATYAMTGELNLRGDVMPIGGVKEKILAAKRDQLSAVILPEQNQPEFSKIKDLVGDLDIIWVKHADEVLKRVLMPQIKRLKT
jgi:ATP-dependent Lon protease